MRLHPADDRKRIRLRPVLALGAAGTAAVILAILAPTLELFLPTVVRQHELELDLLVLAATYAIARVVVRRARSLGPTGDRVAWLLDRADATAQVALAGGLSIVFAGACLVFLATWLPHYLLWPWGRDADTFATLARSWDEGIRPYRDIRGYNFPGAIYLHWLLGRSFGWGRTWPLYAFDAAGLIALGLVLVAWSRRCLGRMLPGLASCLIFSTYYMSHGFETVAQRDWHTSLCIGLALLILQGWPGRATRVLSAILAAAALATRPHAVLFLPAMASAVLEPADRAGAGSPETADTPHRRLAGWLLMVGAFTAIAFSPLVFAGIADDLILGLRIAAYGGPYSRADLSTATRVLVEELFEPGSAIAIATLGLTLLATRGEARRRGITWALALGAALIYRLFHPVQHRYLEYPLVLFSLISLAISIDWIIDRAAVPPAIRAIIVLGMIGKIDLGIPNYCSHRGTIEALAAMARGEAIPIHKPPGAREWFDIEWGRWYPWEDYRNTLIYLRATTSPETLVANVLRQPPFPTVNGPTGRLSPFLAESGICWMWLVPIDLEPEFASTLERATNCVVVWAPQEERNIWKMRLSRLTAVIREHYRPEARFGRIEVWRRADASP